MNITWQIFTYRIRACTRWYRTSLYTFTGPMGSQYQYICAGVIITMIPILIIFLFCQKQIYSGMAMGAVKE